MKRIVFIFLAIVILAWSTVFYFVPAFSGRISVSPGFEIAGISLHYYGMLVAAAILVGFLLAMRLAPRYGLNRADVEAVLPWLIIFGFLGARIYFVAFAWEHFLGNPWGVIEIWKGGLSIYGAIIGAACGLAIYAKRKLLPAGKFFDLAAVVVPLSQAIGRFGNFFNQEAFGSPTDLPWKLYISPAGRPKHYLTEKFYHPAFLYEALWDLLVFAVMWMLFRRAVQNPNRPGHLFGFYLILYSLGRFFIEDLRLDSFFVGQVRLDQATALLMMAAGLIIIIYHEYRTQAK